MTVQNEKAKHGGGVVSGRKGCQSGTATVEAAIILPLLILAVVTVLSVVRIVSTYSRVQHALNQVALELSRYSYIYAMSGLQQKHDDILDDLVEAKEELKSQTEAITAFYRSIESVAGDVSAFGQNTDYMESISNIISKAENAEYSSEKLQEAINEILDDPVYEIQLIGMALSDSLLSKTKTALFSAIASNMITNNLSKELDADREKVGKLLSIKGGIKQLDFSCSTFFSDKETIDIIVEYTVEPKPKVFIFPEIKLRNRATILAWSLGAGSKASSDNTSDKTKDDESVWNLSKDKNPTSQHFARGNKIDKIFAEELKKKAGEHADITPYNFKTIDLIEYAHDGKDGSLVMIFSLNPFLPTYSNKSAVIGTIKQNLYELSTFQSYTVRDFTIDVEMLQGKYKRVAYIIVPENEPLPEAYVQAFEECRKTAEKMGIELHQVQKYGKYDNGEEDEEKKD